jgi:2-polyprenyl-6-methoxyphenol hydroxylase-like FAD-dependent oxidoreductase
MTDCEMNQHRFSLPLGKMRQQVWKRQQRLAQELLDTRSSELIQKTEHPFIQAITEALSPRASFFDGKVLLVGDALATLRPLSGQGTNQSARSAMLLKKVLQGRMRLREWEQSCLEYVQSANQFGIDRERTAQLGPL